MFNFRNSMSEMYRDANSRYSGHGGGGSPLKRRAHSVLLFEVRQVCASEEGQAILRRLCPMSGKKVILRMFRDKLEDQEAGGIPEEKLPQRFRWVSFGYRRWKYGVCLWNKTHAIWEIHTFGLHAWQPVVSDDISGELAKVIGKVSMFEWIDNDPGWAPVPCTDCGQPRELL
jgi:hypothetical protein